MKNEAAYHLNTLIENLGYTAYNAQLVKIKQSNKKPCYITHFDLDKCSISGFIFQNDDKEWIFNLNQSSSTISQVDFNAKVKESEFLYKQLKRYQAKEAKINLSQKDIKEKDIQIKKERKFKNNNE